LVLLKEYSTETSALAYQTPTRCHDTKYSNTDVTNFMKFSHNPKGSTKAV